MARGKSNGGEQRSEDLSAEQKNENVKNSAKKVQSQLAIYEYFKNLTE